MIVDLLFGGFCILAAVWVFITPNDKLFRILSRWGNKKYDPESKSIQKYLMMIRGLFVLLAAVGGYIVVTVVFP
jgi:hypothetical protein